MAWTDEKLAALRRHYKKDKSAREIAELVDMSRSAVVSKAQRLGLGKNPPKRKPRLVKAPTRSRVTHREKIRAAQSRSVNLRERHTGHSGGISPGFQAPAPRRCQWLHGEPRERNFCGEPCRSGSSYCDDHHTRCYVPPEGRTRDQFTPPTNGRLTQGLPS